MAGLASRRVLGLEDSRVAAAGMLAIAALRPLVPGDFSVACPLRELTGIPCPLCGMTTSVTATVRLDWGEAAAATPAGIVAVVLAVALLVAPPRSGVSVPAWVVPTGLTVMWLYQLIRLSIV